MIVKHRKQFHAKLNSYWRNEWNAGPPGEVMTCSKVDSEQLSSRTSFQLEDEVLDTSEP